ncbi:MAG TPA: tyrosine-type recombinase/integrase [Syntrophorhabdales bacterium]|nr:tyrosine-type recombinase/integrase [Syntrophorhabdales bacterium]
MRLPCNTGSKMRHTFGAWLAQDGRETYTIARYAGHKGLECTKRYLHHNAESLRASIGTIEKMTGTLQRIAEIDG